MSTSVEIPLRPLNPDFPDTPIAISSRPSYFEVPSHKDFSITDLTVSVPSAAPPDDVPTPAARWKTPEFVLYGIAFVLVVPTFILWTPIRLSLASNPNYPLYQHLLSPGWIPGRCVDNSDRQYRSFRDNFPALVLLSALFLFLSRAYSQLFLKNASSSRADAFGRLPFMILFSLGMLAGLHGASALKILFILTVNYLIAKFTRASIAGPVLTWTFNIGILFANELQDGYKFQALHTGLDVLDRYQGIYPRWHISFNITMLRLVSYNLDHYWACRENHSPTAFDIDSIGSARTRASTPHPLALYNFPNYIAYALYPPLYFAGPIITYNDFLWQLRRPLTIPLRSVLLYALRFVICFLTMEFVLHFMYVVAIKEARAWKGDSPLELSMIGVWNLIIVWLKLLIPWRFFRLWALADGIDPPENMIRCMVNNYSTLGFWRSWHRSYNLWILRYIYIPLGGSHKALQSTLVVFTFVALWHDLSLRLLTWGWLVVLFILPELAAQHVLSLKKYGRESWYRHVCAVGGVCNLLMMATANLVGFVLGTEGTMYLASQLFGTWNGIRFMVVACACLWIDVQLLFEYREAEKREGIYRKC